jgi:hypothetical protein
MGLRSKVVLSRSTRHVLAKNAAPVVEVLVPADTAIDQVVTGEVAAAAATKLIKSS